MSLAQATCDHVLWLLTIELHIHDLGKLTDTLGIAVEHAVVTPTQLDQHRSCDTTHIVNYLYPLPDLPQWSVSGTFPVQCEHLIATCSACSQVVQFTLYNIIVMWAFVRYCHRTHKPHVHYRVPFRPGYNYPYTLGYMRAPWHATVVFFYTFVSLLLRGYVICNTLCTFM